MKLQKRYNLIWQRHGLLANKNKLTMESQKKSFDFNQGPAKLLITTVHLRVMGGLLHLNLQSGTHSSTFLFPLDVAKKIAKAIVQQVEEVEKKNKITFDDRLLNEPMLSPLSFGTQPPQNRKDDGKDQNEDDNKKKKN